MTKVVCHKGKCIEADKAFLESSPSWTMIEKIEHDLLLGHMV